MFGLSYMNPFLLLSAGLGILVLLKGADSTITAKNIPNKVEKIELPEGLLAFPKIQISEQGQKAPLVIVLHGRNASEKQLTYTIPADLPARVMFLRANLPKNVFFEPRLVEDPEIVKPAIEEAGKTLALGINKLLKIYPTNKVVILGYSQGGELAEYMATLNWSIPLRIASFSGGLTENLFPNKNPQGNIKLKIWHGADDKVVPYAMDVATYNAFKDAGYNVTFETGDDLSHVSPPKKIADKYLKELIQN